MSVRSGYKVYPNELIVKKSSNTRIFKIKKGTTYKKIQYMASMFERGLIEKETEEIELKGFQGVIMRTEYYDLSFNGLLEQKKKYKQKRTNIKDISFILEIPNSDKNASHDYIFVITNEEELIKEMNAFYLEEQNKKLCGLKNKYKILLDDFFLPQYIDGEKGVEIKVEKGELYFEQRVEQEEINKVKNYYETILEKKGFTENLYFEFVTKEDGLRVNIKLNEEKQIKVTKRLIKELYKKVENSVWEIKVEEKENKIFFVEDEKWNAKGRKVIVLVLQINDGKITDYYLENREFSKENEIYSLLIGKKYEVV